jgi:hypothetical protein
MAITKVNQEIRNEIAKAGLKNYEVAYMIGITEGQFSKWLHLPLTAEREKRIKAALAKTE